MPQFRIEVVYTDRKRVFKVFEADTDEDAQELAESEDWRTWDILDSDGSDTYIDSIEPIDD